ncbi:MAG: ABC transporter permease [Planctomycetaceae bacterium]|nr:ABC transporter permease [Planctomycetaceae bacterium]
MWNRILALIVKEFLAVLKDPKSRVSIIAPPLIQMFVFSYAATFDIKNVPYAVYNEDGGAASRELLAGFSGSPAFEQKYIIERQGQIADLVDRQEVLMVVHVDRQFSRDLLSGNPARLQIIVDGRNSNTAQVAFTYVQEIVSTFNEHWAARHGATQPPARLEIRAWYNPNLVSRWFIVPGLVGVVLQVATLLVTSLSVAREREQGTFDQLLVTPLRPVEILIGKAAPGFVIGLADATIIALLAHFWFGVPMTGSVLALYLGMVLFLFSAVGVGLMISSLAATMQQALLGTFLFLLPSILLSGFATPIENMPPVLQEITRIIPLRYFMVILRGVYLEGGDVSMYLNQFWPMAVIGVLCLAIAGWLFRHRTT